MLLQISQYVFNVYLNIHATAGKTSSALWSLFLQLFQSDFSFKHPVCVVNEEGYNPLSHKETRHSFDRIIYCATLNLQDILYFITHLGGLPLGHNVLYSMRRNKCETCVYVAANPSGHWHRLHNTPPPIFLKSITRIVYFPRWTKVKHTVKVNHCYTS